MIDKRRFDTIDLVRQIVLKHPPKKLNEECDDKSHDQVDITENFRPEFCKYIMYSLRDEI